MLKISYAGSFGLSKGISSQFTLEMCAAAKNCEKIAETHLWGSRSFKVMDVDKTKKKPVTSACYDKQMSVFICNRFHSRRANSVKNNVF